MSQPQESPNQNNKEQSTIASSAKPERKDVNVWVAGATLGVDVGGGQHVEIPNPHGREPTREEIYQALVAAGHQERAAELTDRAYGNVMGTG